jgi:hypothetical protein
LTSTGGLSVADSGALAVAGATGNKDTVYYVQQRGGKMSTDTLVSFVVTGSYTLSGTGEMCITTASTLALIRWRTACTGARTCW